MKTYILMGILILFSVPAMGQTYLAHNHSDLGFLEGNGAILLDQNDDVKLFECAEASNPQRCLLRKAPRYKRHLGATFSISCTGKSPFSAKVKNLIPTAWGHSAYVMAGISPGIPKGAICVARKGAGAWGGKGLRKLEQRPLNRSDISLLKRRVTKRLRSHLTQICIDKNGHGEVNCEGVVKRAVDRGVVGLYSARLPGSRIGVAVASVPDLWDHGFNGESGGEVEVVATIDSGGSVVEFLGTAAVDCGSGSCGHVLGVGDLDGNGFEDILFDARGELFPGMGEIKLIGWYGQSLVSRVLGSWGGG